MERTGKAKELWDQAERNYRDDKEEAIAKYSEVIKLLPNDHESYWSRGNCYLRSEQLEEANADYEKAVSLDPKNGGYYSSLSATYLRLGENEKASEALEKAVNLDNKKAGVYYYIFADNIFSSTGNKKEAAVYFKKSVEHGDWDGYAKERLAEWKM